LTFSFVPMVFVAGVTGLSSNRGRLIQPELGTQANVKTQRKGPPPAKEFSCLPGDVRPDEVVSSKGSRRITVREKLAQMKARCRNGRLVDAKRREIRFFHTSCWGNPPPDYLEIQKRENEELAKLKRRFAVVVFECNPMVQ
jgi:hypothetical protein